MTIWILTTLLALAVAGLLAWPVIRRGMVPPDRRLHDRLVYRDQLSELDRDRARGLIGEDEAKAARLEIARRLLATEGADAPAAAPPRAPRWALGVLIVAVPVAALALYAGLGAPETLDQAEADPARAEMSRMVDRLAAKMATRPQDLTGWKLLARSAAALGRYGEAVEAYRTALALDGQQDLTLIGDFAETLCLSERAVGPEARRAFQAILEREPKDARARHYLAEERAEAGQLDEALAQWSAIARDASSDADYLPVIRGRLIDVARRLGRDPNRVLADAGLAAEAPGLEAPGLEAPGPAAPGSGAPGPGAADIAAAATMDAGTRGDMIRAMVERLAERLKTQPDDKAGWLRLGRAYLVLGRAEDAVAAYDKAVALDPASREGLTGLADALRQAKGPADARYLQALDRVLSADPDNAEALMVLGAEDLRQGRAEAAAAKWRRLLSGMPPDGPGRAEARARMAAIAKDLGRDLASLGL